MVDKKEIIETAGSNSPTENGTAYFDHFEDPTKDRNQPRRIARQSTYEEHGPGIDHDIPQALEKPSHAELTWPRIRAYMQEPFCEFWGTFIIIMFGDGVVAQVVLSQGVKGSYQSISWGWG